MTFPHPTPGPSHMVWRKARGKKPGLLNSLILSRPAACTSFFYSIVHAQGNPPFVIFFLGSFSVFLPGKNTISEAHLKSSSFPHSSLPEFGILISRNNEWETINVSFYLVPKWRTFSTLVCGLARVILFFFSLIMHNLLQRRVQLHYRVVARQKVWLHSHPCHIGDTWPVLLGSHQLSWQVWVSALGGTSWECQQTSTLKLPSLLAV